METVWSLVIVVIVAVAAGLVVWAVDKRHSAYGIMLPIASAVASACVLWIILVWAGTGYLTGLIWMPWVLPMAAAVAAAAAVPMLVGRRRVKHDGEALTQLLRSFRA